MKMRSMVTAVFLLFAGCAGSLFAEAVLFDGGKSDAVIVLEDEASNNAKYAARELQHYLKKSGGVEIPIRNQPGSGTNVYIGESSFTKKAGLSLDGLTYDGFKIVCKGKDLYIFGRDRKIRTPLVGQHSPYQAVHIYNKNLDISAYGEAGTLYGVYCFLRDHAGIEWFMPGETGEVVPEMKRLAVQDTELAKSPAYYFRTPYYFLFNYDPDSAVWYRRAGFGAPFPVEINHSFYLMNRFQKDHPEWFALIDGKRDFNISCEGRGNLCLSNKELLAQFIRDAREYFDRNPDLGVFPVMPNDWFHRVCDCEDCQKQVDKDKPQNGQFSNYVWNFVNEVAKEVGKTHPGKFIACCAYGKYAAMPDRVKLEPNVAVMLTKVRYFNFDEEGYKYRNEILPFEWKKVVKNFFVWEYYCWDTQQSHLSGLPVFFPHWTSEDMKAFRNVMAGEFIDGGATPRNGWKAMNPFLNSINYYIAGRLYWDPDLDVDLLLEDFYTRFYGPGAADMKKFWTRAEELWTDKKVTKRGPSDNIHSTLYTPEVLLELKEYVESAMRKVPEGSVYAERIAGLQKEFYPHVEKMTNVRSQIPSTTILRTSEKPVIDGVREPLWRSANVVDFVRQFDAAAPLAETYARLLHDDDYLYIFVNCFEPDMQGIVTEQKENHCRKQPYLWDDDSIEIFISPDDRVPDRTIQLIINAAGVYLDGAYRTKEFAHPNEFDYDSGLICKTGKDKNGWTLELAVPKKALILDGNPPTQNWRLNICRNRNVSNITKKDKEYSCWSPILGVAWNVPGRFGKAVISNETCTKTTQP